MAKGNNLLWIGLVLIIASYAPVPLLSNDVLRSLTIEDGPYESLGAGFFFLASMVFLYAFLRPRNRNLFFLLFAIAFLFAAGEEISWGQRIFHFATPAFFQANNAQDEFSIHNLRVFQHEQGIGSSITGLFLNFNRLFIVFWILYCILVPLANKYSGRVRSLLLRLRLPVLSIWFGALFLLNEATSKTLELFVINCQSNCPAIFEIKECLWGLLVLLWGFYLMPKYVSAEDMAPGVDLSAAKPSRGEP